jgi:hypothetical protein
MTEEELINEGFEKVYVDKEESGNKDDYYYYTYELAIDTSIITCANDEAKNGWYAYSDIDLSGRITDIEDVRILKQLIEKWSISHKNG